ncbi:MAG: DUF4162 domain-containing protein [DPANN group archaeon]|nr:DUF4162 domain-containing protein [DPANN group archaeon]
MDSPENLKRKIGGDIIRLKFKGERNLSALKKLKFVKKIDKFENGAALTVSDASKHLQEILKVIGTVESVEMRTPTLNDVFLHYTGKEYHPNGESPEGGFFEKAMTYRARSK